VILPAALIDEIHLYAQVSGIRGVVDVSGSFMFADHSFRCQPGLPCTWVGALPTLSFPPPQLFFSLFIGVLSTSQTETALQVEHPHPASVFSPSSTGCSGRPVFCGDLPCWFPLIRSSFSPGSLRHGTSPVSHRIRQISGSSLLELPI